MDEQDRVREQTARNVAGLEAEQRGDWAAAIALYERNAAEGFAGDWPYGRLVLLYGRRDQPAEVVRVLERAVAVFEALPRSQPERMPRLRAFRQRLKEARRALHPPRPVRRRPGGAGGTARTDPATDAATHPTGGAARPE
jgi:hypothetical protein